MDSARVEELRETLDGILTAPNMLYWMSGARIGYAILSTTLQKYSAAYRVSPKKLNLTNYWLQLVVYTPVLPLFIWAIVDIHGNNDENMERGLKIFANIAMLLLAMYAMELYLRGHLMDPSLWIHHLLLIVITLYVVSGNDESVNDPLDIIDFGFIEGLGAMTEHPTFLAMIYYRYYSDTPTLEEKKRIQPAVQKRMWVSVVSFAVVKLALVVASFTWYGLRFSHIRSSNLVWIVPVLRFLHMPTLVWSCYVQWLLYLKVAQPLDSADEELAEQQHDDEIRAKMEEGVLGEEESNANIETTSQLSSSSSELNS